MVCRLFSATWIRPRRRLGKRRLARVTRRQDRRLQLPPRWRRKRRPPTSRSRRRKRHRWLPHRKYRTPYFRSRSACPTSNRSFPGFPGSRYRPNPVQAQPKSECEGAARQNQRPTAVVHALPARLCLAVACTSFSMSGGNASIMAVSATLTR